MFLAAGIGDNWCISRDVFIVLPLCILPTRT